MKKWSKISFFIAQLQTVNPLTWEHVIGYGDSVVLVVVVEVLVVVVEVLLDEGEVLVTVVEEEVHV